MTPAKRKKMMRIHRLRWWRKQREKFYHMGLRSDGKPRLTDRMPVTAPERLRRLRKSQKARRQRFIAKKHAQGLSARGNPLRKKKVPLLVKIHSQIAQECSSQRRAFCFS